MTGHYKQLQEIEMLTTNNAQRKQMQHTKIYLNQIKLLKGLSASDIMVFMVLKCFENKNTRESYPSVKTIIEHTGLSRGSILRAFQKLKDKELIRLEGKTVLNVNRWSFSSIRTDTSPVSEPIPPSIRTDTSPVSELIHKSNKLTEKETVNLKVSTCDSAGLLAEKDDERLFLQLWEKWSNHNLFKWSSVVCPLEDWKTIKEDVQDKIKDKDLLKELVCIDIFCMQQWMKKTGGKDYEGAPVVWSDQRWMAGIIKWLSSDTSSYINAQKKPYLKYAISLEGSASIVSISQASKQPERVEKKQADKIDISEWENRLGTIYEDFEEHENPDLLEQNFAELYGLLISTCTPKEMKAIRADTKFYELFYSVEENK